VIASEFVGSAVWSSATHGRRSYGGRERGCFEPGHAHDDDPLLIFQYWLATAARAGATGLVTVRADSTFYAYPIIAAARRAGARFSVTARLTPAVTSAITTIAEDAWTPIHYPNAIWDDEQQRLVSDAEVAETGFTAFTSRRRSEHITARLIVRRVRRLNPTTVAAGQTEAFAVYRYHAVFTDSAEPTLAAEATHRDHAIVEQVIADLKDSALAHLPSGVFTANAAWLACAAISHNLRTWAVDPG
jgi:hypothetical protein